MGSKNLFEDRASADDLSLTVNEEFAARLEVALTVHASSSGLSSGITRK